MRQTFRGSVVADRQVARGSRKGAAGERAPGGVSGGSHFGVCGRHQCELGNERSGFDANRGVVAAGAMEMFEAFGGLGSEGKTTARGAPKNPLQLGATVWHFRHESRATSPPIWIQNLILPPLAALANLFGVRPTTTAGTAAT